MNVLLLCLGLLVILAIIIGCIALIRYLSYKQTLNLAEQGFVRPETANSKPLFRWGMAITILGLVLTFGLYAIGFFMADSYPLHLGPWMLGGLIPLFLGLSLVLLHYLTERE
jgi:hypothetical protein